MYLKKIYLTMYSVTVCGEDFDGKASSGTYIQQFWLYMYLRKVLMTTLLVFSAIKTAYIFEEYFFNNAICILQLRLNMYLRKISMTTLLVFCHRDRSVHYWKSDCHTKLRNRPSHLYLSFSHNTKHRKNCEYCPGHSLTISHLPLMSWFQFFDLSGIHSLSLSLSLSLS